MSKFNFNMPKFDPPKINHEMFSDLRDPDEVTTKILGFLQVQSNNARRQFRTSRNLILATIIIMILQIGYAVWTNYESNSRQNNLIEIVEMQSIQSNTISEMSLNLIDLQSQVQNLKQENAKKNLELND